MEPLKRSPLASLTVVNGIHTWFVRICIETIVFFARELSLSSCIVIDSVLVFLSWFLLYYLHTLDIQITVVVVVVVVAVAVVVVVFWPWIFCHLLASCLHKFFLSFWRSILEVSCAFLDAVNTGYCAKTEACVTRVANNNFRDNFHGNIFWCVQGMSQILVIRFPDN